MKIGRISESILKRSVLRQIKTHRDEVLKGAGVGEDCAFFSWDRSATAVSTQTVTLPTGLAPDLAVLAAVNNLAAGGAEPFAVTAAVTLPVEAEESQLKIIMSRLERKCKDLGIELAGGHTEVSPAVSTPVISITAFGKVRNTSNTRGNAEKQQNRCERGKDTSSKPLITERGNKDLDIVVSKWIGLEGTVILANDKQEELLGRYPQNLILAAQRFEPYLSVLPEAALADESDVYMMHDMRNGGIFAALWEISQRIGVGLTIDLKKIP
ncbi:MAG: hydrogenase maturation factor, partial [Lachnospiraceae bacterium]|nr:hydrogenase maturation factor [Lachnospiraceae bacterium]